uniref:Uncharacterized protein n=2 Tax=Cyprinus carpio TaxID=7962 RepID=A0A8C2GFK7_CYPCA
MSKSRPLKKEKISVASEVNGILIHIKLYVIFCQFYLIVSFIFYSSEKELQVLRGENRKNMMLSVALLAISAFFYYTFIY